MIRQLLLALALISAASASDPQPDALKLATDAAAAANIFTAGKPLKLVARLRSGDRVLGAYGIQTDGASAWRDEIQVAEYTETRIGTGNSIYRRASAQRTPAADLANNIRAMINLPSTLLDAGYRASSKPKQQKHDGRDLTCFDTRFDDYDSSSFCFDDARHLALFSNEDLRSEPAYFGYTNFSVFQNKMSARYSDFATFHDKWYPRTIEFRSRATIPVTVEITALEDAPPSSDGFFDHDDRFSKTSGCLVEKPPVLLKRGYPDKPGSGIVTVHFVIAADGLVHDAESLSPRAGPLAPATIAYLKSSRYRPAECEGKPIAVERWITARYDMVGVIR